MNSRLVFGAASLAGKGKGYSLGELEDISEEGLVNYAIEHGIKTFDLAPIYGFNQAEKTMGKIVHQKRDEVVLISKGGITWHDNGRVNKDNSVQTIDKMFHESLRNLKTDYIDIYFIHWPDERVDIRYCLERLQELKDQKKLCHIGLSNTFTEDFEKAKEVCEVEYLQSECNLFSQTPFQKSGLTHMGWGSYDKGILASSVDLKRQFSSFDARSYATWWKKSKWRKKVEFVHGLKKKFNLSSSALRGLALSFALSKVDLPIIGFKKREQIDEALKIENSALNESDLYKRVVDEFSRF